MKQLLVFLTVSLISIISYSQTQFSADINFESNSQLVDIDTTQTNNLWQIGIPQKSILDSAYSAPFAIITDTINPYQSNNFSSFQVKIITPNSSCWGIGNLTFVHKYDFELNKDGGFIEVKYDNDTNWTNIILDTDPDVFAQGNNFYTLSDTLIGNIPAFTGTSNGWIYSQFVWAWVIGVKSYYHDSLTIRFSIKSDSVDTYQEGWLIDNIFLQLDDCTGSIKNLDLISNSSKVFPNPVIGNSNICFSNQSNKLTVINVFDNFGDNVRSITTYLDKIEIANNEFENGIYSYQIIQNNEFIGNGKFVILK